MADFSIWIHQSNLRYCKTCLPEAQSSDGACRDTVLLQPSCVGELFRLDLFLQRRVVRGDFPFSFCISQVARIVFQLTTWIPSQQESLTAPGFCKPAGHSGALVG